MRYPRCPLAPVLALAALGALARPALAEDAQDTYLPMCGEDDPLASTLLGQLQEALGAGNDQLAAELLDRLCVVASHPVVGNRLVELQEGVWYRGLRSHVRALCEDLPRGVRDALVTLQDEGARLAREQGEPPTDLQLLRRFPLSAQGFLAGTRLLARAVEAGDAPLAHYYAALLRRLNPVEYAKADLDAGPAWLDGALKQLQPPPQPVSAPNAVAKLQPKVRVALGVPPQEDAPFSPSFPCLIDGRLWVSTGAWALAFNLDGEPLGRVPQDGPMASAPPDPATRFSARIESVAGLAFSPFVLERWVARARLGPSRDGRQDAAFSGRYYSLVGFDPVSAKILWWDGDPGPGGYEPGAGDPTGVPPGWNQANPELLGVLLRGHVLATVADSQRVYVALALKADEPDLRVFAFDRGVSDQQALVLRPAWRRTSYLLSAERPGGGGEDEAVYPEISAALSLDGEGHLLCTTSVGVASCLATADGTVVWTRRAPSPPGRMGFDRRRETTPLELTPPPSPALVLDAGPEGRRAVFFAGSKLVATRVDTGAEVWSQHNQSTSRLLLDGDVLVAYGGHRIVAFDAKSGHFLRIQPLNEYRCSGEAIAWSDGFLFPLQAARPGRSPYGATSIRYVRLVKGERGVSFQLGASYSLESERGAVNLAPIPGGVAAASRSHLHLMRWSR